MEKGYMITPGGVFGVRWHKGNPGILGAVVTNKPKIVAYSCSKCGYIENYVEQGNSEK